MIAPPAVEKTAAPEPAVEAATHVETESEPVAKSEVVEPAEEPLPEGVQKRIAKEVRRQAEAQRQIDEAVSTRKAKESELAKLTTDAPGSQPVTKAQASSEGKPKRPAFGETGHENETYAQYESRQNTHEENVATWATAEALRKFEANQEAKTAKSKATERWDAAVKEHGAEFPALMDTVVANSSEQFQLAVSSMEGWDKLAIHLGKNEAKLKELSGEFATNPYEVVAQLGRMRDSLQTTKPAIQAKPLPEPLAKVGGNASVSGQDFQSMVESGSMSQLRAAIKRANAK